MNADGGDKVTFHKIPADRLAKWHKKIDRRWKIFCRASSIYYRIEQTKRGFLKSCYINECSDPVFMRYVEEGLDMNDDDLIRYIHDRLTTGKGKNNVYVESIGRFYGDKSIHVETRDNKGQVEQRFSVTQAKPVQRFSFLDCIKKLFFRWWQ